MILEIKTSENKNKEITKQWNLIKKYSYHDIYPPVVINWQEFQRVLILKENWKESYRYINENLEELEVICKTIPDWFLEEEKITWKYPVTDIFHDISAKSDIYKLESTYKFWYIVCYVEWIETQIKAKVNFWIYYDEGLQKNQVLAFCYENWKPIPSNIPLESNELSSLINTYAINTEEKY